MARLMLAEARRLWTVWSTYVIFGIVVALDLLFCFILAFAPGSRNGGGTAGIVPHGSLEWFQAIFHVLDNSRLLALVLGVLIVTGEYRHKTVTPTFLAQPKRDRVVGAKLGVGLIAGLALGVTTMLTGLVVGLILVGVGVHSCVIFGGGAPGVTVAQGMSHAACMVRHGHWSSASINDLWTAWSKIAPGVIVGTGLFAIYGVGLGALLKNQIVAIVVGLGFTLVVETIIVAVWPTIGEYLPGQSATALEDAGRIAAFGSTGSQLLPWWGGAVMLVIYGVALSVIGTMTTLRGDVT